VVRSRDTKVLFGVSFLAHAGENVEGSSFRYRFGASLNLELAVDSAVVPFDCVQSEDQPLANLLIREPQRNELEHF
jgi:hypothetical protein